MDTAWHKERFEYERLKRFAVAALRAAGLADERAAVVAATLLEGDLMGHATHGLALLPPYVASMEEGQMTVEGDPRVVSDRGSALAWDGRYLPGAWLTHEAISDGLRRMDEYPVVTVTIQNSHHIGSLASYPLRAVERGFMMLLCCSDPNSEVVAPFGGIDAVYSPNPMAAGIPTSGRPVLFDTSMSTTAWGVVNRAKLGSKRLPGAWLLDKEGFPTDEPSALEAGGTILPLGGLEHGYKGFALGLMVEALTGALGGSGRAKRPGRWSCSTFMQLIDPSAFGGGEAFLGEMDFLAERCRASRARPGMDSVRLPGERALALKEEQQGAGVALGEQVRAGLSALGARLGLAL